MLRTEVIRHRWRGGNSQMGELLSSVARTTRNLAMQNVGLDGGGELERGTKQLVRTT